MKNLIVLAVAALFATNAVAAEMKWTGSAGWRYAQSSLNDNLDSKNNANENKDVSTEKARMHQMRANLGVMGGWENVEYGFGMRTGAGAAGPKTSDWQTVQNGGDQGIGIEQAWFRYVRDFGGVDLAATFGRQKMALATDTSWQTLLDNDNRWDGFGWNFKFGMFGLNAVQYVLGAVNVAGTATGAGVSSYTYTEATDNIATTKGKFMTLFAFQPHMTWKFSDEIEAMFAVAYYKWNTAGYTNNIGANRTFANAGTIPALAGSTYNMDNKSQWDILMNLSLPFNLTFVADFVKSSKATYNTAQVAAYNGETNNADVRKPDVSSTAWTVGLTYGQLRKAQDFTVGYAYTTKGIGSVVNGYTNDIFPADYKGHTVVAGYSLADNFHLGFRWNTRSEKERIAVGAQTHANGAGLPYDKSAGGVAGRNTNQKQTVNYWELTAGVAF